MTKYEIEIKEKSSNGGAVLFWILVLLALFAMMGK